MDKRTLLVWDFFEEYAKNFNAALHAPTLDTSKIVASFSDSFIGSGPAGINCGKNDAQLKETMRKGYAFYKSIGILSMGIVAKEITQLDNLHSMAKIYWRSGFRKKDGTKGEIDFTVIYFLREQENSAKIFAYIAGDEQKALKENGLVTV